MTFDVYLKLDNIDGESTDDKHSGQIELISFDYGIDQPSEGPGSGKGAAGFGRAEFKEFRCVKYLDKATANLHKAAANGTNIGSGTLEVCQATGEKSVVLKVEFSNLMVSDVKTGNAMDISQFNIPAEKSSDTFLEYVAFKYGKIKTTYTEYDHDTGASKGNTEFGWDVSKNTAQ